MPVWQYRAIRFDTRFLKPREGERVIDAIDSVEDTKGAEGSRGSRGRLSVTNLRLTWRSHADRRTNISVGLQCISAIKLRTVRSRQHGDLEQLMLMTNVRGAWHEFLFSAPSHAPSPRVFETLKVVHAAFEQSKLYRDVKLRGAIVVGGTSLALLPHEQVFSRTEGVMNLATNFGNLGVMVVTTVRVVWFAALAPSYNASVPYIQIERVRIAKVSSGSSLVIKCAQGAGGYQLGFAFPSAAKMGEICDEISSLWKTFTKSPVFGVDVAERATVEPTAGAKESHEGSAAAAPRADDDVEIVESSAGADASSAAYYVAGGRGGGGGARSGAPSAGPVWNSELGLAVEPLPDGVTLRELWMLST
jgi:Bardet-Biedl syndrome 5 protein